MSLSLSRQYQLDWQQLSPTLSVETASDLAFDYLALQPRAVACLEAFLENRASKLLLLKTNEKAQISQQLEKFIEKTPINWGQDEAQNEIAGACYHIQQGDDSTLAQVSVCQARSKQDNFASQHKVATALYFDHASLFGNIRWHVKTQTLQLEPGLVHTTNTGVLILSLAHFLTHFELWLQLKNILVTEQFDWYSLDPRKALPCAIPGYPLRLKVILLGSREELAQFAELELELTEQAHYGEIDSYFALEQPSQQQLWANFVCHFAKQQGLAPLDNTGLNKLYQLLVRESEDRHLINIDLPKLQQLLVSAGAFAKQQRLTAAHFAKVLQRQQYQHSFLQQQAYKDILQEQVYIATEGEIVGQVNGLSVIEYQGTPIIFGEPSRISCIVNFGDGEIVDIDRKNELAGNVHGKGMMIAEACLMGLMNFQSQLPFSASLVFEQSYSDIDGDSASLAIFCVLLSALADLPLPQSIAITGAIDQFGLVHPVGGINHKIEGFFAICAKRGLTGQQGVIIPALACQQLSLSEEVISAVKQQQFFIWAVEDVYQAVEILFKRELIEAKDKSDRQEDLPLSYFIHQRIEQKAELSPKRTWFNWFRRER